MRLLTILFVITSFMLLSACSNNVKYKNMQAVEQIYAGFHCGAQTRGASLEWVDDQMLLERAFGKLSKQFSSSRTSAPKINFEKQRVVIVYMGQQPTAGYSLALAGDSLRIDKSTADVTLQWRKPQVGMMTAQVITSPCVVLSLPREGYGVFRVLDRKGGVMVRGAVGG